MNIVASLCENEVIVPVVYEWTTKHVWFKWHLCPKLPLNSVIFMDNASWYRKSVLEAITKFYGYTIIWLPTYSPDKNRNKIFAQSQPITEAETTVYYGCLYYVQLRKNYLGTNAPEERGIKPVQIEHLWVNLKS